MRRWPLVWVVPALLWFVSSGAAAAGSEGVALLPGVSVYGPLAEVPAGHWAYRTLERLIGAGIVLEYRPGLLDGERTISRYEAALLLVDAFRRLSAVTEPQPSGSGLLKGLVVGRAVEAAGVSATERGWLAGALAALGREFSSELAVLGFQVVSGEEELATPPLSLTPRASLALEVAGEKGVPPRAPGRGPAGSGAPAQTTLPEAGIPDKPAQKTAEGEEEAVPSSAVEAPTDDLVGVTPDLPAPQPLQGVRGVSGVVRAGAGSAASAGTGAPEVSAYRLGMSVSQPGRFGVGTVIPVGAVSGSTEFGAVVSVPDGQWVWARLGRIEPPGGSAFALGEGELVDLQGIEARLMSRDLKTGVLVARGTGAPGGVGLIGAPQAGFGEAPGAIAALDGSLVISKEVVVGAAIVKGAPSTEELVSAADGPAVTSVVTRYRPVPWLTLTGEYAQNLWALPLLSGAMQLDASLRLGELRLGARLGAVAPDFRPAVGHLRPGARMGVDAAVSLGHVMVKAGATRLNPSDGQPELSTVFGVRMGPAAGASVSADYELISVEELASGQRPERSRTSVSVDWGAEYASLSVGVAWSERLSAGSGSENPGTGLEARASIAYRLSPGATVVLGYRLIDFGGSQSEPSRSDAIAQLSVRF